MDTTHLPSSRLTRSPLLKQYLFGTALLYVFVWILGLAIPVPDVDTHGSHGETWDVVHHNVNLGFQSLLVHGIAGIFILSMSLQFFRRRVQRADHQAHMPWLIASGIVAGGISLIQFVIEESLVLGALGSDATNIQDRWQFVLTIDGLKMFALASLILAFAFGGHNPGRWERGVSIAGAIALVMSGIGYLFDIEAWMQLAAISLPLLLLSVFISARSELQGVDTD